MLHLFVLACTLAVLATATILVLHDILPRLHVLFGATP